MEIVVPMLIISLGLSLGFLAAYLWANKNKQFDDLKSPAWRIILEDKKTDSNDKEKTHAESI